MESVLTIFHLLLPPGFIEFGITLIIYHVNVTRFLSIIYSCEKSKFTYKMFKVYLLLLVYVVQFCFDLLFQIIFALCS